MGDGYWRPGNVHPFPSSGRFGSPQWNDRKSKKPKHVGKKGKRFKKEAEPKKEAKGKKARLRKWVSPRLRGQPPDWKEGD
jgi:hypothetical protein